MPKTQKEYFSQRLAKIRKAKGLTQLELAKLTGFSRRAIAHYETKIKEIPQNNISILAKALNVSTDELLGHKPVKENKEINRAIIKKAQMLDELPAKDQNSVLEFIDALHSRHITRKSKRNSK